MNTQLASLILARITAANLPWVDKVAGLTRAISTRRPTLLMYSTPAKSSA